MFKIFNKNKKYKRRFFIVFYKVDETHNNLISILNENYPSSSLIEKEIKSKPRPSNIKDDSDIQLINIIELSEKDYWSFAK